jgi:hypothetical protein
MSDKRFAIITPVFLEHNYINFFIEYHLSLGFDMIYILIDNSTQQQDEYVIFDEFRPFVKMFDIKMFYSPEMIHSFLLKKTKDFLIHNALIDYIYPVVTEDYTILLGVDSFLYLNNLSIRDYFKVNGITDNICQIFFRWKCLENVIYSSKYNLFNCIDNNETFNQLHNNNQHYFTMGKRSLVLRPSENSHFYTMNETGTGFYEGSVFEINSDDGYWTIEKNMNAIKHYNSHHSANILHYLCRDIQNCVVKEVEYWNETTSRAERILKLKNIILSNSDLRRIRKMINKQHYPILNVNIKFKPIDRDNYYYDDKLYYKIMNECNISKDIVLNWISEFVNFDKDEVSRLLTEKMQVIVEPIKYDIEPNFNFLPNRRNFKHASIKLSFF